MSASPQLLPARIRDCVLRAGKRGAPVFVGFLTLEERRQAQNAAKGLSPNFAFYGGHEAAERTFFGAFPAGEEIDFSRFPVAALTVRYPQRFPLTHRDFLGALMALGIKREAVGDIFAAQGQCALFLSGDIAEYVFAQLGAVGNVGVKPERGAPADFSPAQRYLELRETVSAARLDSVVSALLKLSREDSADLIWSGLVREFELSVRSKGKFIIDSVSTQTKKGRLVLLARKYL